MASNIDPVAAMLIEHECGKLVLRYGMNIDFQDDEGVLAVFAKDALWNHASKGPLRGRGKIAEFLAGRDRTTLMRHAMTNILIEVIDETHARGVTYWTGYTAFDHKPGVIEPTRAPFSVGEYHDEFILEDGRWVIAKRDMRYTFRG